MGMLSAVGMKPEAYSEGSRTSRRVVDSDGLVIRDLTLRSVSR